MCLVFRLFLSTFIYYTLLGLMSIENHPKR
nr:MAG TPA: hypothetical protein [Caudoviricetes sp.]